MKTDWRKIAEARGLDIHSAELDRIVPILEGIERAFRPLTAEILHETEPVTVLSDAAVVGE